MANNALISLWGTTVGAIAWSDDEQIGRFEFEPEFLNGIWDIAPIMMPLESSKGRIYEFLENSRYDSSFRGLPGLLADMLPDKYGNALINAWLVTQGRSSNELNPVETLCFIGSRGIGALEIKPTLGSVTKKSSVLELDGLISVANKILDTRQNFQTALSQNDQIALADILQIGTSAGGARAKAIIAFNEKSMEVRSGQVKAPNGFGYWILKFDGVEDSQFGTTKGYGRVEMAYHLMAKAAGIEMSECRLLEENGRAHFMTRRFDRDDAGNKIHMQSLYALRHFDFNMVGSFAYEQLFETMRMLGLPYPEAEQMFIRMVFNVLARNCDDHTKNFAFLMDNKGNWRLSPAYDICYAYRTDSPWVSKQSMTVNGKREGIESSDFVEVAKRMNVKQARTIIERVSKAVSNWNHYAEEVKVESKLRDAIKKTLLA